MAHILQMSFKSFSRSSRRSVFLEMPTAAAAGLMPLCIDSSNACCASCGFESSSRGLAMFNSSFFMGQKPPPRTRPLTAFARTCAIWTVWLPVEFLTRDFTLFCFSRETEPTCIRQVRPVSPLPLAPVRCCRLDRLPAPRPRPRRSFSPVMLPSFTVPPVP